MVDAFKVVRDFEAALCEYTGAPFAVTTTSCTMALLLAVAWHLRHPAYLIRKANADDYMCVAGMRPGQITWIDPEHVSIITERQPIEIPKRTYVGVPYAIIEAGGWPVFRDEAWRGVYQLKPLPVWDSARWLTSGMCVGVGSMAQPHTPFRNVAGQMVCVSFHWSKTLSIQQGGAILHDNPEADAWLRRARFDGRTEGVPPAKDDFTLPRAWHAYMSPEVAAEGLVRLSHLPKHNEPMPNDDYPDLSQIEAFR